jgi:predicted nucleotidyltransferase component of viral defense system
MSLPELNSFCLVGGTALSLKYGHRKSIDLDLFSNEKFDIKAIEKALEKEFGNDVVYEHQNIKWAVFCKIKNVKIDIVHYPHEPIAPFEISDSIKMYSTKDIAAMKINAILGRGAKKDFWDLVELLKEFSLKEILEFHKLKFPSQMLLISIPQAIIYFVDAEESEDPISLKGQTWKGIKKTLQLKVREFLS